MSRHSLRIVIIIVACVSAANPVLAGLNDSRFALFGAAADAAEATCTGPSYDPSPEPDDA